MTGLDDRARNRVRQGELSPKTFETGAFDHSATLPRLGFTGLFAQSWELRFATCILPLFTAQVQSTTQKAAPQQKLEATTVTNLRKAQPSGVYYLFARIGGKLKKKSLETDVFSTAKLRLADRLKAEPRFWD